MNIPDHYKLLELEPSANIADIKKAYRRLAQLYHPDKNNNDLYAREHFNAIKQAYEVLTNPSKKEKYLQQRWYRQTAGLRKTKKEIITPDNLLKQALELDKYVSRLDVHRMDEEGLAAYIHELLSTENIEKLNVFNELTINEEITNALLRSSRPLPYPLQIKVHERLERLNNTTSGSTYFKKQIIVRKKNHQWDKYRVIIILVIVIMLVLLIFLAA